MVFSVITTIAPCWGPLVVKDTGTLTIRNLSGGTVTVSSVDISDAFTATPSTPLPAALAPGVSLDLTVKFVATDGRIHNGTLTIHSDDPTAPTRTVTWPASGRTCRKTRSFLRPPPSRTSTRSSTACTAT